MRRVKKYSIKSLDTTVYVDSHAHYHFSFSLNWRGQYRHCEFSPDVHDLVVSNRRKGDNWSIVSKYPAYLGTDLNLKLYATLFSSGFKFYEKYQDGSRRYENFRYHSKDSFYGMVFSIIGNLPVGDEQMIEVFNEHVAVGDTVAMPSLDELYNYQDNLAVVVEPAVMKDGFTDIIVRDKDDKTACVSLRQLTPTIPDNLT